MNLTSDNVLLCVEKGEGTRVEFKRKLPRDERAARTLCAFANTRGGLLLVGVTDHRSIHGVHRPEEVCDKLVELSTRWLRPLLRVQLQIVEVRGPSIVACSVPFSRERPHAVLAPDGGEEFLVRVGASNRVADGQTLRALRRDRRSPRGLTAFEQTILEWVRRQKPMPSHPGGHATVARFAHTHNVSEARARRSFVKLESLGILLGHGGGRARIFITP